MSFLGIQFLFLKGKVVLIGILFRVNTVRFLIGVHNYISVYKKTFWRREKHIGKEECVESIDFSR